MDIRIIKIGTAREAAPGEGKFLMFIFSPTFVGRNNFLDAMVTFHWLLR